MRVLYPSTWANILFNWNHSFLGLICFNFDSYRVETSARKAEVIYLKKQQLQAEKIKTDSNKKGTQKNERQNCARLAVLFQLLQAQQELITLFPQGFHLLRDWDHSPVLKILGRLHHLSLGSFNMWYRWPI